MFKKCLKYDLKSIWSVWWIVALSVAVIGMVGCVCLRLYIEQMVNNVIFFGVLGIIMRIVLMLIFIFSAVAVSAFAVLTPILVFIRFYKNFFTDEGYLTFTLPVSRRTLYLSKTVSAMIWTVASSLVIILIVLFGMLVIPPTGVNTDMPGVYMPNHTIVGPFDLIVFREIGQALTAVWDAVGAWSIVYGLELLMAAVLFALFELGVIQMCITIGSVIAKRHKLIASIGIYYGINSAITTAISILLTVSEITMIPGIEHVISNDMPVTQGCALIAVLGLIVLVVCAVLCSIIHFIALGNVERRLNLA